MNRHSEARGNETKRKECNREYADQRRNTRKSEIKIGDYVLVKQEKKNKLSVNFNQKPCKVIKRTGVEISAQSNDGHIFTRNISHFKRTDKQNDDTDDEQYEYQQNSSYNSQPRASSGTTVMPRRSNRVRRPPDRYGLA